ncbi:dnm1l [Symbiodinium sp. CCMP2592]|nr:dnm1l [Symbiodinium sp. CCMP2592]
MSAIYENLRQLITVVDELRDVGLQHYISLPRIAAIGTQSSGKSSLIESIVGLDFLPRGGGVVTRRPLELRLVHLNSQEYAEDKAWAVFDKVGDKKFTNFDEVRQEIERQTDQVAGSNKGIVNDPIILTIYATGAPDLTLIDLPGVTRVPVKGSDQKEDIEKLTKDMTLHYINDPRTIVLAVLPANQDMSVSDSLQLARQVDPQGLRSIGVITKIDIMDQGTDAATMLRGEDVPLRLGYVGVKMRSQQDIANKKPVKDSLKDEKEWFDNHRIYGKLPPGMIGTPVLIDKLTQILFKHIRRFLPEIKKEINEKRRSVQDRLDELGEGVPLQTGERVQVMWTLVTDYCEMFKNTIRGKYDRKLQRYMCNLTGGGAQGGSGGAKIRTIMNDFLIDFMETKITSDMSDDDIDKAIRLHEGDSLPGFPSPDTFEFLALPHLQKLAIPSVECVHNISAALDVLSQRMAHAVFRRFPKMAESVLNLTQNIIQEQKDETRRIVEEQIACSIGYLFTNDPNYLINHGSMEPMYEQQQQKPPPPVEEEKKEPGMAEKVKDATKQGYQSVSSTVSSMLKKTEAQRKQQRYSGPFVAEIRKRLDSYFELTVRNIRDSIPKAIGFYLVRAVQDKLQFELLNALNHPDKLSELLGEPPHIVEERRTLNNQLQVLMKASSVLTRDPTLAAIAFEAEDEAAASPRASPAPSKPMPSAASAGAGPTVPVSTMPSMPPSAKPAVSVPAPAPKPAGSTSLFGASSAPPRSSLFEARFTSELMRRDLAAGDLTVAAWCCASAEHLNEHFLQKLAKDILMKLPDMGYQDLANVSWAFAKLSVQNDELFEAIAEEVVRKLQEFEPQNLAITAWAFATLARTEESMFQAIAAESQRKIARFDPQCCANLLYAFGKLAVQDEKLLEMVVSRVEKTADRFKMLELCNAAWGISKMSFPVDKIDKGMQARLSIPTRRECCCARLLPFVYFASSRPDAAHAALGAATFRLTC